MFTAEEIAQVAHEANRALQIVLADEKIPVSPPWSELDVETRDSAINGVDFHIANPGAGPRGSHDNWVKFKVANGWKYGRVKDEVKKEHPLLVEYGNLYVEDKIKDELFVAIVRALTK